MVTNIPHHRTTLLVELNYQILEEAWCLPLSTTERRDLLVALPLVCTSFRWIANRLFLRDAHVVSPAYATHFLSLLQRLASQSVDSFEQRCRSITFHIYDPDTPPNVLNVRASSSAASSAARALETSLRALSRDVALAPALRRVALHYTGWSFTHELEHARLAHLPTCVRALELRFVTPAPFAQRLRQTYSRHYALPMPGVRSLMIYGACPAFIADVARACPALETLETDNDADGARELLALQPSLLPFVSHMVGDGAPVKGLVETCESKPGNLEWCGNVLKKCETRTRDWKRGRRGDTK